ncbi:MAG: translation initiation factor IF-3 [Lentisphaerae bacterium]|nr:translation initiation factor IF-3 [Lentisphaerota bacterium]
MAPYPDRARSQSRTFVRVNHNIRVPEVRCIDADGNMVGVIATREARSLAEQRGLDLVEVSPNAEPPVCRIMDFGKYRYEESRKQREARRHHHSHAIKEIKFRANVAEHDYQTKVGHLKEFLRKGYKVKVSLMFRGRENAHRELGFELVNRVLKDCGDGGSVDQPPRLMGRTIIAMLSGRPSRN